MEINSMEDITKLIEYYKEKDIELKLDFDDLNIIFNDLGIEDQEKFNNNISEIKKEITNVNTMLKHLSKMFELSIHNTFEKMNEEEILNLNNIRIEQIKAEKQKLLEDREALLKDTTYKKNLELHQVTRSEIRTAFSKNHDFSNYIDDFYLFLNKLDIEDIKKSILEESQSIENLYKNTDVSNIMLKEIFSEKERYNRVIDYLEKVQELNDTIEKYSITDTKTLMKNGLKNFENESKNLDNPIENDVSNCINEIIYKNAIIDLKTTLKKLPNDINSILSELKDFISKGYDSSLSVNKQISNNSEKYKNFYSKSMKKLYNMTNYEEYEPLSGEIIKIDEEIKENDNKIKSLEQMDITEIKENFYNVEEINISNKLRDVVKYSSIIKSVAGEEVNVENLQTLQNNSYNLKKAEEQLTKINDLIKEFNSIIYNNDKYKELLNAKKNQQEKVEALKYEKSLKNAPMREIDDKINETIQKKSYAGYFAKRKFEKDLEKLNQDKEIMEREFSTIKTKIHAENSHLINTTNDLNNITKPLEKKAREILKNASYRLDFEEILKALNSEQKKLKDAVSDAKKEFKDPEKGLKLSEKFEEISRIAHNSSNKISVDDNINLTEEQLEELMKSFKVADEGIDKEELEKKASRTR